MATKLANTFSAAEKASLAVLKVALENGNPALYEQLCADLASMLLDVPVFVAKTGYQFGADAGTAGLRGRSLRIECKRYLESTALDARALKGEVVEAVQRDPALEAWVLMTTKTMKETDRNSLVDAGRTNGVPVVILDWTLPPMGLPTMAVLCAKWPKLLGKYYGASAEAAALALSPRAEAAVKTIRRDLEHWNIGFKAVRAASVVRLSNVWTKKNESYAYLNQDVAGGSLPQLLKRSTIASGLNAWWKDATKLNLPLVITGLEGVGKTWAAVHWLIENNDALPIVLVIPASAWGSSFAATDTGLLELLASHLKSLAHGLDETYMKSRLERLLQRPEAEGPVLFIVVDGLNQEPSFPWKDLVRLLQGEMFKGRVRLLLTSRTTYFEQDLRSLRSVAVRPDVIRLGSYDQTPGGEFDQILALYGTSRAAIHSSLHSLAATPRLLPLVVRLAGTPALQSEATVNRLLWEYGRDVLQNRAHNAFTEDAWVEWLIERAKHYRSLLASGPAAPHSLTYNELARSAESPDIGPRGLALRLSELVDAEHLIDTAPGTTTRYKISPAAMTLGLALALIDALEAAAPSGATSVDEALAKWLDPIGPIDQTAEILRAAASVLSGTDTSDGSAVSTAVLVAWMQSQNLPATHPADVHAIGDALPQTLVNVVERSHLRSHASAQHLAAQSLRRINVARTADWDAIRERFVKWCSRVLCPLPSDVAKGTQHYAEGQAKKLLRRVGTASPGENAVLGVPLTLAYGSNADLVSVIPLVLEGHELKDFGRMFAAAAVANAVTHDYAGRGWQGLKWLVAIGARDASDVRQQLRLMSLDVANRPVEADVEPLLSKAVAARLLWLSATEQDEIAAHHIDPRLDGGWDYQADYLDQLGKGYFVPERRHASEVLSAVTIKLHSRLQKTRRYLPDPSFDIPLHVRREIEIGAASFQVEGMHDGSQRTAEDSNFDELQMGIGRNSPIDLAKLVRRRLKFMGTQTGERKYWIGLRAREFLLLIEPVHAAALGRVRLGTRLSSESKESIANCWILQSELLHRPGIEQLEVLADTCSAHLTRDLLGVIEAVSPIDLRGFFDRRGKGDAAAMKVVLQHLATNRQVLDDDFAKELLVFLGDKREDLRVSAFVSLAFCAPELMGRQLRALGWRPPTAEVVEAHYGSTAVMAAMKQEPFTEVIGLLAPWRYLDAAVRRGGDAAELRLAVAAVGKVLGAPGSSAPDLPADISLKADHGDEISRYRVVERSQPSEDSLESLKQSFDIDDAQRRLEDISERTATQVDKVRAEGAGLYLQTVKVADVDAAWSVDSALVSEWLDGMQGPTQAFLHRVARAEGLFLSLCEVLLSRQPATGGNLWRLLRKRMHTRFLGKADISELEHMLFRVPESPEVLALRQELLALQTSNTDGDLLNVVIAALLNGQRAWLEAQMAVDAATDDQWRHKRAIVMRELASEPDIAKLDWPVGPFVGTWQGLRSRMRYWAIRGALARYWWRDFLVAPTVEQAYASWQLFLSCVDRRAWIWMTADSEVLMQPSPLARLKELHLSVNIHELERAMLSKENESPKFGDHFLGDDAPAGWMLLDGETH